MELKCPNCQSTIHTDNVNITTDLAKCDVCNTLHKASKLLNPMPPADLNKPPKGSSVQVVKGYGDSVELHYPKKGFSIATIPILIFATFWISFVAFWTWGASQASVLFALFSVPFWFAGGALFVGVVNGISESQTLIVNRRKIRIIKKRPIKPMTKELYINDIQLIEVRSVKNSFMDMGSIKNTNSANGSRNKTAVAPAIITENDTCYFFERASHEEQQWIVSALATFIGQP